jgi:hypothetical protein
MALRWRWILVAVMAAAVLGGILPQALLGGTQAPAEMTVLAATGPPTFPSGCSGASCGRSAPAAPAPILTIAGVAVLAAAVVTLSGRGISRRIRSRAHTLPRGTTMVLFRPPQFS